MKNRILEAINVYGQKNIWLSIEKIKTPLDRLVMRHYFFEALTLKNENFFMEMEK